MKKIILLLFSLLFFSCVSAGDNSPVVNDVSPDVNIEFPDPDSDSIINDNLNKDLNTSLLSLFSRRY